MDGVVARAAAMQEAMLGVVSDLLAEAEKEREEKRKACDPTYDALAAGVKGKGRKRRGGAHGAQREDSTLPCGQRMLHLFSGPPGRADGLAMMARQRGIHVEEVDTLVDKHECDLTRDEVYERLMARARAGVYAGAMIGT